MRPTVVYPLLASLLLPSSASFAETVTQASPLEEHVAAAAGPVQAGTASPTAAAGGAKWDGTYQAKNASATAGLYCTSDDKTVAPFAVAGGKASFPVWLEEQFKGAIELRHNHGTASLPAVAIHDVAIDADGTGSAVIAIAPDLVAAQRTRAAQPGPYQNTAIATALKVVTEGGRGRLHVTVTEVVEKPESHPTPPSCDFDAVKH
jgi:hypothetical protein